MHSHAIHFCLTLPWRHRVLGYRRISLADVAGLREYFPDDIDLAVR